MSILSNLNGTTATSIFFKDTERVCIHIKKDDFVEDYIYEYMSFSEKQLRYVEESDLFFKNVINSLTTLEKLIVKRKDLYSSIKVSIYQIQDVELERIYHRLHYTHALSIDQKWYMNMHKEEYEELKKEAHKIDTANKINNF